VVAPWFSLRKANTLVNTTLSLATLNETYEIPLWVKNLANQMVLCDGFTVGPLSAPELPAAAQL